MEKRILEFTANEQILIKTSGIEHYASDVVSYVEAHFALGDNWSGFDSVRAVWFTDFKSIATVLDSEGVCLVPFEVLNRKGIVRVNLVGSISEDDVLTDRLTTYPICALEVDKKAKADGENTTPITPSQFEQFASAVRQDADRAEQGATASAASASASASSATASEQSASQATGYAQNASESAVSAEHAKDDAEDARDEIRAMRAEAVTLPAGSEATASYADGLLSLGIPRGNKGDKGDKGDTGAKGDKGDTGEVAQAEFDALSADVTDLKSDFVNFTKGTENIGINHVFVNGGMTSGQVVPTIKYRVATDEIITFDRNITLTVASGFRIGIHFFDSEGVYTNETGWRQGNYTVNANQGFKIVISRTAESGSEVANIHEFTSKVTYESDAEYRLSQVEDATDDLTAEVYKTLTPQITDTATGKYISTSGVIGTLNFGAYSTAIPILKGDEINLRCIANTAMSAISYCYSDLSHITPAVIGTSYSVADYKLIADRTGFIVLSYYKDSEHTLTIKRPLFDKSVLFEKQTIWCGDSIMRGNAFNDSKSGWSGRIADASRCMYKNYAEGGACITRGVSQTGKTAVVDQIENAYNDYPDADYIIFDGGCNDADLIGNATGETKPEAFGTFSENDFSGNYDATTFCGAMETICMKLSQHWLGKHIGYVVPHKMGVSNNYHAGHNNYRTYYETAIQICAKWGVSVLNLWDGSYLNPKHNWMCDTNNTMTEQEIYDAGFLYADRQHLTSAGYDYEAPIVMEWVKEL